MGAIDAEVSLNGVLTRGDVSVYLSTGLISCQPIIPWLLPQDYQAQCGLMVSVRTNNPATLKFAVSARIQTEDGVVADHDAVLVAEPRDFATMIIWTGGVQQKVAKVLDFTVAEIPADQIRSFSTTTP